MTLERERDAVIDVLKDNKALTQADLQVLRKNAAAVPLFSSHYDPFRFRMDIELIDAIRSLDCSTTRLMWVAIGVAVVGVVFSAAQILTAVLLRR